MAVIGYIRVSTDKQNYKHQRFEIEEYAKNQGLKIDDWIEETISSRKALKNRKLGALLENLQENDILITCEISRLGRSLLEVMRILETCLNKNCQVWTLKENYHLGNDIQSKVLAFAFGLAAEIERNLISQRTKSSLANLKASGKKLGRPFSAESKKLIDFLETILNNAENDLFKQNEIHLNFKEISYTVLFDENIKKFCADPKNIEKIEDYSKCYDELLAASPIFKRGVFSQYNADATIANLNENRFFDAEHEVILNGIEKPISSIAELQTIVQKERNKIFIVADDIFVINSYEDEYFSPNSAKLMVKKDLKKSYDDIMEKIQLSQHSLEEALKEYFNSNDVDFTKEITSLYGKSSRRFNCRGSGSCTDGSEDTD